MKTPSEILCEQLEELFDGPPLINDDDGKLVQPRVIGVRLIEKAMAEHEELIAGFMEKLATEPELLDVGRLTPQKVLRAAAAALRNRTRPFVPEDGYVDDVERRNAAFIAKGGRLPDVP